MRHKPYLVMTHDESGMFLWMTTKLPYRKDNHFVCSDKAASRMRIPVSWFGGMLEQGRSIIRDIEETFGDPGVSIPLLLADRYDSKVEKLPKQLRVTKCNAGGLAELMSKIDASRPES